MYKPADSLSALRQLQRAESRSPHMHIHWILTNGSNRAPPLLFLIMHQCLLAICHSNLPAACARSTMEAKLPVIALQSCFVLEFTSLNFSFIYLNASTSLFAPVITTKFRCFDKGRHASQTALYLLKVRLCRLSQSRITQFVIST